MLTKESLVGELMTPIPNVIHHGMAQNLEMLRDVSVGENSRNEELKRVKDEWVHLTEEMNDYKMEMVKLELTLLEKKVTMKATTRSLVDLEGIVNRLETRKSFLLQTNEEAVSCS